MNSLPSQQGAFKVGDRIRTTGKNNAPRKFFEAGQRGKILCITKAPLRSEFDWAKIEWASEPIWKNRTTHELRPGRFELIRRNDWEDDLELV